MVYRIAWDSGIERPPLSKEYLCGERDFTRILLRPEAFWQERDITLGLGKAALHCLPQPVVRNTDFRWAHRLS